MNFLVGTKMADVKQSFATMIIYYQIISYFSKIIVEPPNYLVQVDQNTMLYTYFKWQYISLQLYYNRMA